MGHSASVKNQQFRRRTIAYWLGGLVALLLILYLVRSILLPFVASFFIAYFLDPVVDKLEKWRFPRGLASILVLSLFFIISTALALLLVPVFIEQILALIKDMSGYFSGMKDDWLNDIKHWFSGFNFSDLSNLPEQFSGSLSSIYPGATSLLENVLQSGGAIINLLSLFFITPVVGFYMLRDWDMMINYLDTLLPRKHAKTIREQMRLIDQTLAGYIRGQMNVCLLLGVFYAVGLSAVGLNSGFVIGFMTGLLSFVPYVGMLFGTAIGLLAAYLQFGTIEGIAMVAAVFAVGQVLEGNFVTPKIVGDKVGLHPVWIIFGMLAGAALFGFVGILLAVPVSAVVGVLVRFFIGEYKKSSLYLEKSNTHLT